MKINSCTCMLLLVIPFRFLIEWLPSLNLSFISTALVGVSYLCMAKCLYDKQANYKRHLNKDGTYLLCLYIIYSIFVLYHLFFKPQLEPTQMAQVPKTIGSFLQSTISIGIPVYLAMYCKDKVDFLFFAKFTVIFISLLLIVYFVIVDANNYIRLRLMQGVQRDDFIESQGLLSPLTLSKHVISAYVCNLWVGRKWCKYSLLNTIIFYSCLFFLFSCLFLLAERGVILFAIFTTLFFYYCKSNNFGRYTLILTAFVAIILVLGDYIISFLSPVFGHVFERFYSIFEDGGSGRLGDEDSIYSTSIEQIYNNLSLGSYPRIISHTWMDGMYPHNIFLEIFMTLGLVIGLPLCLLIFKAIKSSVYAIRNNKSEGLFCLLFFCYSSCLLTSGTLMLHRQFWISFAMALSVTALNKPKLKVSSHMKILFKI